MLNEITQKKSGDIVLECDCGNIHTIRYNEDTEEVELKTIHTKKSEVDNDTGNKKTKHSKTKKDGEPEPEPEKRKGLFF